MRPPRVAIGVMAKAPVPGYAKTRLIPLLGADGAAALQQQLILRTVALARSVSPTLLQLFVGGDAAHPLWAQCDRDHGAQLSPQRGDDLGVRMRDALLSMRQQADVAIVIGTDCVAMQAAHIEAAAASLASARMVFIPADDGGYVLVGAREPHPAAFTTSIDWGSERVMQQTRDALSSQGWRSPDDWRELPPLWDIDRPEDYQRALQLGALVR